MLSLAFTGFSQRIRISVYNPKVESVLRIAVMPVNLLLTKDNNRAVSLSLKCAHLHGDAGYGSLLRCPSLEFSLRLDPTVIILLDGP